MQPDASYRVKVRVKDTTSTLYAFQDVLLLPIAQLITRMNANDQLEPVF